ncbi:DUF3077 domain-containing protein [Pseudomonas sp. ACN5]|uniref:DUF3077 domain-containing protein n=1 Tax=Pseudomonas sp. ACN5 TaxID=1920427 RepID=UPI000BB37B5A|nr:DUF3077 domain-containing protein [Pseudomonas sp. ACN5]
MNKSIVTGESTFSLCGDVGNHQDVFAVRPGVPTVYALATASDLLSVSVSTVYGVGMGAEAIEGNQAWLLHHALESAKAIIDSAIEGLGGMV